MYVLYMLYIASQVYLIDKLFSGWEEINYIGLVQWKSNRSVPL